MFLVCGLYWYWVSGLFSGGLLPGEFLGWVTVGWVVAYSVLSWFGSLGSWSASLHAGYCGSAGGLRGLDF